MKAKRIFAWVAIGLIAAMILITMILAISGSPWFQASLYCTLIIPIIIYSGILIYRNAAHRKELPFTDPDEEDE